MKTPKITPELIEVAKLTFKAMAYCETIRPAIETEQKELLDFWKFQIAPEHIEKGREPEIVITWKNAYLLDDTDSRILFAEYDIKVKQLGFNVKPGYCPLLIAENDIHKAEGLLIDASEYMTGISNKTFWTKTSGKMEHYKEMVKLLLTLCAPFCKAESILKELTTV
jgi:hypothetical protein